jgi:spore germination protein KB
MFEWAFKVWPYYALPFEVILPIIIWIFIEIKERMKSRSQSTELEG